MEWNYNLNEAPIDTPIQLLSRDDSPIFPQQEFVGTITYGHGDELVKGECLVGDPDYFYRSAMVAWKEIEKLEQFDKSHGDPYHVVDASASVDETIRILQKLYHDQIEDTFAIEMQDPVALKIRDAFNQALKLLDEQRNVTNEEIYQQSIELEAENERLHDIIEAQRWIPVTERPPKFCESVMITYRLRCDDSLCVGFGTYAEGLRKNIWRVAGRLQGEFEVLAWKPHPEPYRG